MNLPVTIPLWLRHLRLRRRRAAEETYDTARAFIGARNSRRDCPCLQSGAERLDAVARQFFPCRDR